MLSELIKYFEPIESADRISFLYTLANMFEEYGHNGIDIDTSLLVDDSRSLDDLASNVWDKAMVTLERATDEMLVGMGLNVTDATLAYKAELLSAFKVIENTDMHDFVLEVANNDSVPLAERFEQLLEFAMGRPVPEIFDYLEDVPLELMNRIYRVHVHYVQNGERLDTSVARDFTKEISRIKNFFKYCKDHKLTLRAHDLIAAGIKPLMKAEFLLSNNRDLLVELEPEAPDHAAAELIGLLLLCDIDFSNINSVFNKYAELYYTDIDFIARLTSTATDIISRANITGDVAPTEEVQWTNSNTLEWL